MKKKRGRDLIIVAVIITLVFVITILLQNSYGSNGGNHSIDNKSNNGISVFYETLKKLGHPVERSTKLVEEHSISDIQIVVGSFTFDLNDSDVMNWIEEGGTLVYLSDNLYRTANYGSLEKLGDYVDVYSYGQGKLILGPIDIITNYVLYKEGTLDEGRDGAYELLQIIEEQDCYKIYFNERYLYVPNESKSLWSSLSTEQKLVCLQIVILLIAFFYYKGKRFGKPIPLYEEVERTENEFVYSAAALYKYAGCWDLAAENYYKSFLRLINRRHDNWLEYWEQEQLPMFNKAQEVHDFMQAKEAKIKDNKYVYIINLIEQLTEIFKRRRDSYWKQWKINQ